VGADLLEVGRILRAHGLRGEVLVELLSDFPDRLSARSVLVRADDGTELVVERSRQHQGHWLVTFEGIDDRGGAEGLGRPLLLAERRSVPGAMWIDQLVGCVVELVDGTAVGSVVAVEANPASDLLVVDTGALVPLTFVIEHEPSRRVVIDPPAGLLELAEGSSS
jgi:16S rRNA processing protein RimM